MEVEEISSRKVAEAISDIENFTQKGKELVKEIWKGIDRSYSIGITRIQPESPPPLVVG